MKTKKCCCLKTKHKSLLDGNNTNARTFSLRQQFQKKLVGQVQQRYVPDSHEMENPLLWPGTQAATLFPCGFIFAGTQMLVAAEDLSNGE